MTIDFNKVIDRWNTNCSKFDGLKTYYGRSDLLALWIADMDFPVPEKVSMALKERAEHPIYGYNMIPDSYYDAYIQWQEKHHCWKAEKQWLCHTPGVLTALANAILAFTKEGDSVLIQPPVYFPFRSTIEALGRKVVDNQLVYKDGRFAMDMKDLEEKAKLAKLFIFCSPHNPSGRVWTAEELQEVERICRENNLTVFSDEIHSDIVYEPHRHICFASLSDWSREHSIVATAPSKTFNIAGLEMSVIALANEQMRQSYQHLLRFGLHVANPNSFGLAAAEAAYRYGEEWYQELLNYLSGNLEFLDKALKERVPLVRLVYPEATYIPLLDMSGLAMNCEGLNAFLKERVGAALNVGTTFGPGGEGFMRINVATQRSVLESFVSKLEAGVAQL